MFKTTMSVQIFKILCFFYLLIIVELLTVEAFSSTKSSAELIELLSPERTSVTPFWYWRVMSSPRTTHAPDAVVSAIQQLPKPNFFEANNAWNKFMGYTYYTQVMSTDQPAPPIVTRPVPDTSQAKKSDDSTFVVILVVCLVGGFFLVVAIVLILWRLTKGKHTAKRNQTSPAPPKAPIIMLAPSHSGLPPVESTLGLVPRHGGLGSKAMEIASMLPRVPGDMIAVKPQVNPWLK